MNKVWIIERAHRSGQLCNRLGLFAHFVAYCLENEDVLINFNFGEYASGFQNLSLGLITCFPQNKISIPWNGITYRSWQGINLLLTKSPFSYILAADIQPGIILTKDCLDLEQPELRSEIEKSTFILCKGWYFRCFKFLKKNAVAVRKFFEFNRQIESEVLKESIKLRKDVDILVAVHMRLGDYKKHLEGRFYYSPFEYKRLMQATQEIFQDKGRIKFIIFSNEKQSSEMFSGLNIHIAHGSAIHDLCLMSKCDYILGPPSSFSNWASFYGNIPLFYILDPQVLPQAKDFQVHLPLDMGV